ncbi:thioesterase II family protein [Nocardia arthritidis]|uniref:Thioesterase TesA n=1 Tax=Nocardia arthritidis TaxID=228602 RepID=A0A6G9YFJ1_9NOCA|nr:alpha/beta fold hydrolase [Nocardia arthritidis]QIS12055.1 alpha/beta fold hydrolase [Nocardia arthritidis]
MTVIGSTDWLRVLREAAAPRHQLVCFPPGGGSVTAYRALATRFGAGTAVAAVQYPGRQDRLGEAPLRDLEGMAEHIAAEILRQPGVERLALFGHSMGATVAFETARRLELAGQPVTVLFASGRVSPLVRNTGRLHLGSDAGLIDELARLATDPASVQVIRDEPGLAELVLPALRADYHAVETYVYQPGKPLDCPIAVLAGTDDPTMSAADIEQWRPLTSGGFDSRIFAGGHFFLDEKPDEVVDFVERKLKEL